MVKSSVMRDVRKARHMTQKELAKASGVHFVSVCRYETGHSTPSVPVAKKIAAVLGVHWTRLYEEGNKEDGKTLSAKEISALTGMIRSAVNALMQSGEIDSTPTGIRTDGDGDGHGQG